MNDMLLAEYTEARGISHQTLVDTSYFDGQVPVQVAQHRRQGHEQGL